MPPKTFWGDRAISHCMIGSYGPCWRLRACLVALALCVHATGSPQTRTLHTDCSPPSTAVDAKVQASVATAVRRAAALVTSTCPLPRDSSAILREHCRLLVTEHGVPPPGCHRAIVPFLAGNPRHLAPDPERDVKSGLVGLQLEARGTDGAVSSFHLPLRDVMANVTITAVLPAHCFGRSVTMRWRFTIACDAPPQDSTFTHTSLRRRTQVTTLVDGPYLQSTGQTSTLIVWRTTAPAVGVVLIGTSPSTLTLQFSTPTATTDPIVMITGLRAATRYYYTVGAPGLTLQGDSANNFTTLPALGAASSMRAILYGDPGTGDADQVSVHEGIKQYLATTGVPANVFLLLGDNAYNDGTDAEYSAWVFQMYKDVLKQLPMYAILGNHDDTSTLTTGGVGVGPYFARFLTPQAGEGGGVPSASGAFYSFDYGRIHFVCLDSFLSNYLPSGPMVTWLKTDLAAISKSNTDWLIALWHHSPYSMGTISSDSDSGMANMRQYVLPIMEAAGVDLVVGGHSHDYERTPLLNGFYGKSSSWSNNYTVRAGLGRATDPYYKPLGITPNNGMVSVVTGSAGQNTGANFGFNHPANVVLPGGNGKRALNVLGSFVLDVSGNTLIGTFVAPNATVLDQFYIVKAAVLPTQSPTPSPLLTVSSSPTTSRSPTVTLTTSASASGSASGSASASASVSVSISVTSAPSTTATASRSVGSSVSPSPSWTPTPSVTPTVTLTASLTASVSSSPSATRSLGSSPSPSPIILPTPSSSTISSISLSPVPDATASPFPSLSSSDSAAPGGGALRTVTASNNSVLNALGVGGLIGVAVGGALLFIFSVYVVMMRRGGQRRSSPTASAGRRTPSQPKKSTSGAGESSSLKGKASGRSPTREGKSPRREVTGGKGAGKGGRVKESRRGRRSPTSTRKESTLPPSPALASVVVEEKARPSLPPSPLIPAPTPIPAPDPVSRTEQRSLPPATAPPVTEVVPTSARPPRVLVVKMPSPGRPRARTPPGLKRVAHPPKYVLQLRRSMRAEQARIARTSSERGDAPLSPRTQGDDGYWSDGPLASGRHRDHTEEMFPPWRDSDSASRAGYSGARRGVPPYSWSSAGGQGAGPSRVVYQ